MRKVLFATSEAHPFVKTGGLADVSGSLPRALNQSGCDVRLVLPAYRSVKPFLHDAVEVARFTVAGLHEQIVLWQHRAADASIAYFADAPSLFDRPGGPYQDAAGNDWPDNARRFGLF